MGRLIAGVMNEPGLRPSSGPALIAALSRVSFPLESTGARVYAPLFSFLLERTRKTGTGRLPSLGFCYLVTREPSSEAERTRDERARSIRR